MDLELAALGIGRLAERLVSVLCLLVERMILILSPDAGNFARTDEAGDVVDMAIGLVRIDAVLDPDDLFEIEVFHELRLDLFLGHIGVAAFGEQAHLGREQGTLAVNMDGAAFEHEVGGAVGVDALNLADLLRNEIVLIPREIQAVDQTAPGIEFPVNGADIALVVDNERRAAVADPGVVARHFYNADLGGEHVARILILRGADANRHWLELSNGLRDLGKDLLRGLRTVSPVVGAFRPEHPDLFLFFKLTGHSEAVSLRGAFNSLRHFSFLSEIIHKFAGLYCRFLYKLHPHRTMDFSGCLYFAGRM